MNLPSVQIPGQSKLTSTYNTTEAFSTSSMVLLWERKYAILNTLPPFYFASKRNLQCRKTMRLLPSLFWKLSLIPHSSQYTINTSSKYCSNRKGENCFSELGAGTTPTQNEDFLTYCKNVGYNRAAGVLHVTSALSPRHMQTGRPKDLYPDSTTHFYFRFFSTCPSANDCTPSFSPTFLFLVVKVYGLPHCKPATCWPTTHRVNTATTYMLGSP